jgi:hypothetical protein
VHRLSGFVLLAAHLQVLALGAEVAKVTHSGSDYTLTNVRRHLSLSLLSLSLSSERAEPLSRRSAPGLRLGHLLQHQRLHHQPQGRLRGPGQLWRGAARRLWFQPLGDGPGRP